MEKTDNFIKGKYFKVITDIFLILFLFTKTGVLNIPILEYITLGMFMICILVKIILKKKFINSKYFMYYAFFGIYAIVSIFWAWDKKTSMEYVPSIVALIAFIFALSNYIENRSTVEKLMKYTIIANTLAAIKIILLYYFVQGTAAARINSITGIYFNTVGQVIGFSIIFSIYMYKMSSKKIYLWMIIPQFIAIILTESRKSLIIPILGIIIIIIMQKKTRRQVVTYLICAIIIGLTILVAVNVNADIGEKFENLFRYAIGQETDDWSINLRSFFIDTGVDVFKENPINRHWT